MAAVNVSVGESRLCEVGVMTVQANRSETTSPSTSVNR